MLSFSALLSAATEMIGINKAESDIHAEANKKGVSSSSEQTNWEAISKALNCPTSSMTTPTNKTSQLAIFYALLCYAVSDCCHQKNTYVGRIIELDKSVQRVLMQIIKEGEDLKKNARISSSSSLKSPHPDESYLDELNIDEDNESLLDDDYHENITNNKENIRNSNANNTPLSISTTLSKRTPMSIRSPKHQYRSPMARSASRNSINMLSAGFTMSMHKTTTTTSTPMSMSPLDNTNHNSNNSNNHYNRGKMLQMQREALQLKGANEALCNELETLRRQEGTLRTQLAETEARNRSEQLKFETDNLATSNKMRDEYEQRIKSLEHKLQKAQKCAETSNAMKEEIYILKDEVDVLQSSKTKLKQTEEQLRKMKQKVEELGDLNKALASEEEAHSEAVAKCIELENKLAVMAPLKRQLEDYKTRATDAEFRLVDCEDELRKLKESSNDIIDQHKELQVNSQRQKAEVEALRQQMTDDPQSMANNDNKKVGEGMTELNPVLKEELLRLRNENKRLSEFAAKREDDAVQIMEEKLDDANRLADKFKDQFLSTKNALDETKGLLQASLNRESGLKKDILDLKQENTRLNQIIDEERRNAKEAEMKAKETLALTKKQMIEDHVQGVKEMTSNFDAKMNQLECDHLAKYQKLCNEMKEREEQYELTKSDLLSDHAAALALLHSEREEEIKYLKGSHTKEIEDLEQNYSNARQELITKGKQMIEGIQKESNEKIEVLKSSLSTLQNEKDTLMQHQQEYEGRVMNKIACYKQKLNIAEAEIQEVSSECDDLQRNLKKLDKEKKSLQDENDRFRRQMNGRIGCDQSQYEALKHEYNVLLEENRALKSDNNTNTVGFGQENQINSFQANARIGYSMSANVSASSILQIREEYEEKIEELCDEKRQLIMKNSALVTEEKRAITQVWDLERKVKDLQEQKTSLQLQVERFERNRSTSAFPMKRNVSGITHHSSKIAKSCTTPLKDIHVHNVGQPSSPIISPSDSTLPNIEFKSPEFQKSVKSFREKLIDKVSTAKKERTEHNSSSISGLQLADDEWKIHIN